jgi:FKBP-type peptidyl-prolyl cis-trans isomerase SlpA
LHYRLATQDGAEIVSTFHGNPATFQLGTGQLATALEHCLIGLNEGVRQTFHLSSEQAYGARNFELAQYISLATLAMSVSDKDARDKKFTVGDTVEFHAPSGGKFVGMLVSMDERGALFDFNHPLAGQDVIFEVHIIGIL